MTDDTTAAGARLRKWLASGIRFSTYPGGRTGALGDIEAILDALAAARAAAESAIADLKNDTESFEREIDLLKDSLAAARAELKDKDEEIRQLLVELDEKDSELTAARDETEAERLRLAACGLAAQCNTAESIAKHRIGRDSDYYSASYADVCAAVDREIEARARIEPLHSFAKMVMDDWPEGAPDGFDLQDIAEKCGLLIPTTVTEPCGENCSCAEYDDFPQTCYKRHELLREPGE